MKTVPKLTIVLAFLISAMVFLTSFSEKTPKTPKFPFKKAGLTEQQAAAHLLSRFTYGAKPGQIDAVVEMGLEKWFVQQLKANQPDPILQQKLGKYQTLRMTNAQIVQTFPKGGQLLKMAIKDGVINKDDIQKNGNDQAAKRNYRRKLNAYMQQKGLQPQRVLYQELINQKILRATYSENQVQEVLTSFWFNHFNVSLTNRNAAPYLTSYERDVIRPNVLGNFADILLATAKSPAMLTYLDNAKSTADNQNLNAAQKQRQERQMEMVALKQENDTTMQQMQVSQKLKAARKAQGLNENYAREIMELHTLGVDGGYTQQDVTQAARVLTGWTLNPALERNIAKMGNGQKQGRRANALARQGSMAEGDFLFAANRHDRSQKEVLGTSFPAGGGYEEGVQLIKLLASHRATAKFISKKLATRFVSDTPPQSLVDKMAKTYTEKNGDIQAVLLTIVSAPEFWGKEALREKTKSPFELAISAVRSLNAEVKAPFQLYTWITKMGERMYYYQAPTGFPDRGAYWINTGSLLNRMNFGLALAAQQIPGVSIDLMALNQNREPESAEAALLTYAQFLLPERNLQETIKRLTPSLNDPSFGQKVQAASAQNQPMSQMDLPEEEEEVEEMMMNPAGKRKNKKGVARRNIGTENSSGEKEIAAGKPQNQMLAQVVGIIIGSPEFQRR